MKNFQLCHHSSPNHVLMQLGRIDTNIFNMDFRLINMMMGTLQEVSKKSTFSEIYEIRDSHFFPSVIFFSFEQLITFRAPLSALQAFAIALSSFDSKIACE